MFAMGYPYNVSHILEDANDVYHPPCISDIISSLTVAAWRMNLRRFARSLWSWMDLQWFSTGLDCWNYRGPTLQETNAMHQAGQGAVGSNTCLLLAQYVDTSLQLGVNGQSQAFSWNFVRL